MFEKIKAFFARVRVRLLPIGAAVLTALPFVLEYAGAINVTPLLVHYLGESWAAALTPLLVLLFASLKSALHLEPKED